MIYQVLLCSVELNSLDHPFTNLFSEDESVCTSDVDEQLLITLAYKDPVSIKTIKFIAPNDGSGPKKVKLFVNFQTLGFTYGCATACLTFSAKLKITLPRKSLNLLLKTLKQTPSLLLFRQ